MKTIERLKASWSVLIHGLPKPPRFEVIILADTSYNDERRRHHRDARMIHEWAKHRPDAFVRLVNYGSNIMGMRADLVVVTDPPMTHKQRDYIHYMVKPRLKPGAAIIGVDI